MKTFQIVDRLTFIENRNIEVNFIRLIIFAYYLLTFFDSINGFLIKTYGFSINIYFKSFLLISMAITLIKRKELLLLITGLFFTISLSVFYHVSAQYITEWSSIKQDFYFAIKLIFPIISFLFFYITNKKYHFLVNRKFIIRVFTISFVLIVFNVISGLIGIGYSTYNFNNTRLGGIGFFKSGNELSGMLVLSIGTISAFIWYFKRNLIHYLSFSFLSLLIAVLTFSKASLIGVFIILIFVPLLNLKTKLQLKRIMFLFNAVLVFLLFGLYFAYKLGFFIRLEYFYREYGLLFMLTTGRSYFAEISLKILSDTFSICNFLFGLGYDFYTKLFGKEYGVNKVAEIDIIDIFLSYGLILSLLVIIFWLFLIVRSWKKKNSNYWYKFLLFINILLFIMSFSPGHILWSGMLAPFIGLIQIIGEIPHERIKNPTNK